ncbi:MAG: hypothetical protein KDE19_09780 [Caldilineaceae bacterium]|nr:hypothetical protein [Caldilineaceae bacterium]
MNLLIANVLSCTDELYQVQSVDETTPLTAVRSLKMQQYEIKVQPAQYVIVDREPSPPQMLFRFRRGTVVAVDGDQVTLADSEKTLTAKSSTSLFTPSPGDGVIYTGFDHTNWQVLDQIIDGKPAHANELAAAYFPKMAEYR